VQVLARAGAILRAVAGSPTGLSLAELAREVGVPRSSAHRIVRALERERLLAVTADGRVRVGAGVGALAAARSDAIREALHSLLAELRGELGETVDLSVLDGAGARFVDQIPAPHRLRAVSAVGEVFPLHCTANGKALLAALPPAEVESLLPARLERRTPATITGRAALLAELERVREQGVAFDREEHTEGISAVAAAVVEASLPVAAISVPAPTARFERESARYARRVRAAASRASARLAA